MRIPLRQYSDFLVRYLEYQKLRVLLLAAALLSAIGLQLVNPQVARYFIDTAIQGGETKTLVAAAILFIGIVLLHQMLSLVATYLGEKVGWTATNALRKDVARHCLGLDMSFHKAHSPGELIERIDGDVTALADFFSRFVIQVAGNVILAIGTLAILFGEDWRVGFAVLGFIVIVLVVLNSVRDISVPYWTAFRQADAELFGYIEERLAGIDDIRVCGAVTHVINRFLSLARARFLAVLKALLMMIVSLGAGLGLFTLGHIISLGTGIYLFSRGLMTVGTVYLIFNYIELLRRPLQTIVDQMNDLQVAAGSIVRIRELLGTRSKIPQWPVPAAGSMRVGGLAAQAVDVTFHHVSFRYEQDDAVLEDIHFHLQAGRLLGVLGHTGSGKTTIARLLFRLYDPDAGRILLDGADVRQLPLKELRQAIALVTQDVQLFQASVRDNLTLFDDSCASDDQILHILEELGLQDWLASLPAGLDSELHSGGGGLSAGQAQLLAFARAFLKRPRLVILDEASSRLDPVTEQLLEKAIDRLLCGRTAIIIAHRLATVQRADEIMILREGKILEYGRRAQLLSQPDSSLNHLLQIGLGEAQV